MNRKPVFPKISLVVALTLLTMSILFICMLLLSLSGNRGLRSFFESEESSYYENIQRSFTKDLEMRFDGMSLSCEFLVTNEWFIQALRDYESPATGRLRWVEVEAELYALLESLSYNGDDTYEFHLVCQSDRISPISTGILPFSWADIERLARLGAAVSESSGVIYAHGGEAGIPEAASDYFEKRLSMIYTVDAVDSTWYLVASILQSDLFKNSDPRISAILYGSSGDIIHSVNEETLNAETLTSHRLIQYPYLISFSVSPPEDPSYDAIQYTMGIVMGLASTLSIMFIFRRKLLRAISSLLRAIRSHSGMSSPLTLPSCGIAIRNYALTMTLLSLLLPTLLYTFTYYSYARSVLWMRAERLAMAQAEIVYGKVTEFFAQKEVVARTLKYARPVQEYLQSGGNDAKYELVLRLLETKNRQNAYEDIYYFYDIDGELLISSKPYLAAADNITLAASDMYYPVWRYELSFNKGRQNSWSLLRKDPVRNVIVPSNVLSRIGSLLVYFDEQELYDTYIDDIKQLSGSIYLRDGDGIVLSSGDRAVVGTFMEMPDEETTGTGEIRFLRRLEAIRGHLVIETDLNSAMSGANSYIGGIMLQMLLISLLGSLLLNLLVNFLLRPFTDIERALSSLTLKEALLLPRSRISEIDRLGSAFSEMTERINQMVEETYLLSLKNTETRLQMLRAQVNPHFLNNTLETINSMIQLNEYDKATQMLIDLGRFFRYNIKEERKLVLLYDEMCCVSHYCNIQSSFYGERLSIKWDFSEDSLGESVPNLILQPLVENAFIHGFEGMTGDIELYIGARIDGPWLVISVSDNGRGMTEVQMDELKESLYEFGDEHMGVRNVAMRIHLHYNVDDALLIENNETAGLRVQLRLPRSTTMENIGKAE